MQSRGDPVPDGIAPIPVSVLLADDDPGVLGTLAIAFRRAGYAVETAADGARALALLESRPFDLLVLDILMPGATGWEVLARAVERTAPGAALPRAIVMTGFHQEYVVDMGLLRQEGVGAMLLKPFPATDILDEAERVLAAEPHFSLPKAPGVPVP
jgi:CheY-like chemotaxis protein